MALEPYTPDPVAGAATDALGVINRFNDQEPVRSLIANFPDEQIIDWVAFIKNTGAGILIVGNGTPPVGGYTPVTNPIRILGTVGLELGSPLTHVGDLAFREVRAVSTGGGLMDGRKYDVVKFEPSMGSGDITIQSSPPTPPGPIIMHFWCGSDPSVGRLIREDASIICTFPATIHSTATIVWRPQDNNWRLIGGFQIDLTGATP